MNALPGKVLERVELLLPGTPVELIGPVGHETPQPVQIGALFPADAGYLVGPSRLAQASTQVVEDFIRDMNPKWFQLQSFLPSRLLKNLILYLLLGGAAVHRCDKSFGLKPGFSHWGNDLD
jgi:hypothetical protein